jgi:hypothetical protein
LDNPEENLETENSNGPDANKPDNNTPIVSGYLGSWFEKTNPIIVRVLFHVRSGLLVW